MEVSHHNLFFLSLSIICITHGSDTESLAPGRRTAGFVRAAAESSTNSVAVIPCGVDKTHTVAMFRMAVVHRSVGAQPSRIDRQPQ